MVRKCVLIFYVGRWATEPTENGDEDGKRPGVSRRSLFLVPLAMTQASLTHFLPLPFLLAHLSPFPSGIPPYPRLAASLPLFLGQELLICNSIGAKCFAKLLKQLRATG